MIARAVLPAAGRGTRVAALREFVPKECIEIAGLPMIALALVEVALAGIGEAVVIVSPDKPELVRTLEALPPFPSGWLIERLWPRAGECGSPARWPVIRTCEQPHPRGVVDALSHAAGLIGGEDFALVMPDNLLVGPVPALAALAAAPRPPGGAVMGILRIERAQSGAVGNCGAIELGPADGPIHPIRRLGDKRRGHFELPEGVVEIHRAVGRSIVPAAFADLAHPCWEDGAREGPNGEIDDVPRFQQLAGEGRLGGVMLEAELHDLGQPAGIERARAVLES